ncbi:hypothetical protein C8J57DRAFT_1490202 [Mycena rebaudengoi]|nr:hypothetical protein C8J57DRAFT_1490202 [Mycena rebaudengoi]
MVNPIELSLFERLELCLVDRDRALGLSPLVAFSESPALRHVRLINTFIREAILPWEQLTSFHGEGLSVDHCLELLHLTLRLVNCVFTGHKGEWDDGLQVLNPTPPLTPISTIFDYLRAIYSKRIVLPHSPSFDETRFNCYANFEWEQRPPRPEFLYPLPMLVA